MLLIADATERLDQFLARTVPEFSRTRLAKCVDQGLVLVDGEVEKPSYRLFPGMEIEFVPPDAIPAHNLEPADIPLDIIYEDEDVLVVNKPRGLATHPAPSLKAPSLVNALLGRGGSLSGGSEAFRPGIVHRLDRETTGLLVVAKNDAAHLSLAGQMASKEAQRVYVAHVHGTPELERFDVNAPIGRDVRDRTKMAVETKGRPAITHIRRLTRTDQGSLLALKLETGRTHQIRVHMAAIGHPVLGDPLYGARQLEQLPMQLHAACLGFTHPVRGTFTWYFAPLPPDFIAPTPLDMQLLPPLFDPKPAG